MMFTEIPKRTRGKSLPRTAKKSAAATLTVSTNGVPTEVVYHAASISTPRKMTVTAKTRSNSMLPPVAEHAKSLTEEEMAARVMSVLCKQGVINTIPTQQSSEHATLQPVEQRALMSSGCYQRKGSDETLLHEAVPKLALNSITGESQPK